MKNKILPADHIKHIRALYYSGAIDYEKAKKMCEPHLNDINEKAKELSKKYNKKYSPLSFGYVFR